MGRADGPTTGEWALARVRGLAGCRLPVMVSAKATEPWSTWSFSPPAGYASLCMWQLQGSKTCTGSMRKEGVSWVMTVSVSDRWGLQGCGLETVLLFSLHLLVKARHISNIWEVAESNSLWKALQRWHCGQCWYKKGQRDAAIFFSLPKERKILILVLQKDKKWGTRFN